MFQIESRCNKLNNCCFGMRLIGRIKLTQLELILTHLFDKTHLLIFSWFYWPSWYKKIYSNMSYLSYIKPHKNVNKFQNYAKKSFSLSLSNIQSDLCA